MEYPLKHQSLIRLILSFLFIISFNYSTLARIWYLKDQQTGSGNGSSWLNAASSLNYILSQAVAGDEIWIAKGSYSVGSVALKSGVKIYGGFSGYGSETGINDRDLLTNETKFYSSSITCSGTLNSNTIIDGISFAGYSNTYQVNNTALTIDNNSLLTVSKCKFYNLYNNSNTILTAALLIKGGSAPIISDCIFYNNTSVQGAAILIIGPSTPTILNSTFTNNNCTNTNGAAIYLASDFTSGSVTNIKNSIIYNNTPLEIRESIANGNLSVSYSDVKNGYAGTGNINQDPLFKDASNGNFRLLPTSPCLQVGDNSAYNNINSSYDIINHPRVSLNIAGSSSTIDMGAFQFSTAPSNLKYTTPNNFTKNISVANLTPYVDGNPPMSYTINQVLPPGLSLNASTGVISGIPSSVFSPTIFTITASNNAGTSSTTIHISVDIPKPEINYTSPVSYTISETISPSLTPSNTGGGVLGGISSVPKTKSLAINAPSGIVFDHAGNLFILSTSTSSSNSLYKLTPAGNLSVFATGINNANTTGIAIDASDNIYVANKTTKNIHKITSSGVVSVFVNGGNLTDPRGMVVGNDGFLYVTNNTSNNIVKVDLANGNQTVFASNVSTYMAWEGGPQSIAIHNDNTIYTVNGDGTVSKIDPNGIVDKFFAKESFATGNALGMDIDANGIIYVSASRSILPGYGSVQKLNQIGDQFEFASLLGAEHFTRGMKFNANGDLYQVVATANPYLNIFEKGKYTIAASLPSGLNFDNQTGIITGTPTVITPAGNYTITATNGVGSSSFAINLEIKGSILYNTPNVFTKGVSNVNLTPNTNGVIASNFTILPALPSGLSIDVNSGVISGTPSVLTSQTEYTVSAVSNTGNLEGKLTLTVNDVAPSGLSYTSPNIYTKGTAINNLTPSSSGGVVTNYTISPSLPTGLSIDASTGVIFGTPSILATSAIYTVTASNTGGSTSFGIFITVNDVAPSNLSYPSPKIFTKGSAIAMQSPSITGGAVISYSVNPALPIGLTLNTVTGTITGTPSLVTPSAVYTVTATNTGGSTSFGINITVNDVAPTGLTYTSPITLYKNRPAAGISPNLTGGGIVTNYTISPNLPTGLVIDATTGVITGTSIVLSDATNYTVTASNSGGSTTTMVNIKVILFLIAKDSVLQHNNCINDSIGQIVVFAQGGYAPYQYAINGGAFQSNGVFRNLASGIYSFSLMDSTGSIVQVTDTVKTLSNTPIQTFLTQRNNNCFGQNIGSIIIDSVRGGVAPFNYIWDKGIITNNGIIQLAKGNYKLKVVDFYGCKDSTSITITEPLKLVANTTITEPLCYNQSNGILSTVVTGGTASYTYLWSTGSISNTINNLSSGVYNLTVTDANGCISSDTITLNNPLPFKIELDSMVTICTNQVYKKDVKNQNYPNATFNWTSDNSFTSNSSIISVNKAGTYFVRGTNPNGCIATDTLIIRQQNSTIESVFAVATNVFQNDTIHLVNISNPRPDNSIWVYPIDTAVKMIFNNQDSLRLQFKNDGIYTIQLNTKFGACQDSSFQTINILKSSNIKLYNIAPLGLNSIQNLIISPNPSSGKFNISFDLKNSSAINIRILNISNGRLVFSRQYASATYFNIPMNLALAPDLYALIIETEFGATAVNKIMIL